MVAWGYGISVVVFNSISHEWAQRTSEIWRWTLEEKFRVSLCPCIILCLSSWLINATLISDKELTKCECSKRQLCNLRMVIIWFLSTRLTFQFFVFQFPTHETPEFISKLNPPFDIESFFDFFSFCRASIWKHKFKSGKRGFNRCSLNTFVEYVENIIR